MVCMVFFKAICGICWAVDAMLWMSVLNVVFFRNILCMTDVFVRDLNLMSLSYYSRFSRVVIWLMLRLMMLLMMVNSLLFMNGLWRVFRLLFKVRSMQLLSMRPSCGFHWKVLLLITGCINDGSAAHSECLRDTMTIVMSFSSLA